MKVLLGGTMVVLALVSVGLAVLDFPQIAAGLPVGFVIGGLVGMVVLALRLKGFCPKQKGARIAGRPSLCHTGVALKSWSADCS
jgi:hypothetical protein